MTVRPAGGGVTPCSEWVSPRGARYRGLAPTCRPTTCPANEEAPGANLASMAEADPPYCDFCDLPLDQCIHGQPAPVARGVAARLEVSPRHMAHYPGCPHKGDSDDFSGWGLITVDTANAWTAIGNGHPVATDGGDRVGHVGDGPMFRRPTSWPVDRICGRHTTPRPLGRGPGAAGSTTSCPESAPRPARAGCSFVRIFLSAPCGGIRGLAAGAVRACADQWPPALAGRTQRGGRSTSCRGTRADDPLRPPAG